MDPAGAFSGEQEFLGTKFLDLVAQLIDLRFLSGQLVELFLVQLAARRRLGQVVADALLIALQVL